MNKLGYDKFEQRIYMKYCNGAETNYTYDPERRRLSNLSVISGKTSRNLLMDNAYTYDKVDNVLNVTNTAPLPSTGMGGQMSHTYNYDGLYRLTSATGTYKGDGQKSASYSLEMAYDNLHNIVSKKQDLAQMGIQFDGILKAGYELAYSYNSDKPHQIAHIVDDNYRTEGTDGQGITRKAHTYEYDGNGNLVYINTERPKKDGTQTPRSTERKLLWDEENRLEAIDENGYVSNYWYDAAGERTVKTSGESQEMYVNSLFSGGDTQTANFTAYVNPYLVVSKAGQYTKHIYIGSQRIVSKLGDLDSYGADPRRIEYAGTGVDGAKVDYKGKYTTQQQIIKDRYAKFEVPYYGKDNDDYVNGQGFCCDDSNTLKSFSADQNDNPELFQYYYHSDHLGSSSLITNLDGEVVQHIEYVPFGEVFIEERNNTWNTPYLFNAKELDEETGLYYYGARYYDPRTSVWLGVDPLANFNPFEKDNFIDGKHNGGIYNSFNHSVYSYCMQNPVKLVDPNGKQYGSLDFAQGFTGMSPQQLHNYAVNRETEKLAIYAAKPAAISIPLSVSFFGVGFTGFSLTPTWILKGSDQGFHLFGSLSYGLNFSSGNNASVGFMFYWLKGDERYLTSRSFTGKSNDYSLGYKTLNVNYSNFQFDNNGLMEGYGLSLSTQSYGPKKLQFLNLSGSASETKTFDVLRAFSTDRQQKLLNIEKNLDNNTESTKHYYLRKYTNLPLDTHNDL